MLNAAVASYARLSAARAPSPRPAAPSSPAAAVAAVLDAPDGELDYLDAKLAFDALVDPSLDPDWVRAEVGRLEAEARRLAGAEAAEMSIMAALRRVLHESGPWNGHRPFAYDRSDPDGRLLRN